MEKRNLICFIFRCDGEYNCFDASDELKCNVTCDDSMFKCDNQKQCINKVFLCDGEPGKNSSLNFTFCSLSNYLVLTYIKYIFQIVQITLTRRIAVARKTILNVGAVMRNVFSMIGSVTAFSTVPMEAMSMTRDV